MSAGRGAAAAGPNPAGSIAGGGTYFPPQKILVVMTRLDRLWTEKREGRYWVWPPVAPQPLTISALTGVLTPFPSGTTGVQRGALSIIRCAQPGSWGSSWVQTTTHRWISLTPWMQLTGRVTKAGSGGRQTSPRRKRIWHDVEGASGAMGGHRSGNRKQVEGTVGAETREGQVRAGGRGPFDSVLEGWWGVMMVVLDPSRRRGWELPTPGLLRKQLLKATGTDAQRHLQARGATLCDSPRAFSQDVIGGLAGTRIPLN